MHIAEGIKIDEVIFVIENVRQANSDTVDYIADFTIFFSALLPYFQSRKES